MRALLDAIPAAVYVFSLRDGSVLYANAAGKRCMAKSVHNRHPACYQLFCGKEEVCKNCRLIRVLGGPLEPGEVPDAEIIRKIEEIPEYKGRTLLWKGIPAMVELRSENSVCGCSNKQEYSRVSTLVGRCVCMLSTIQSPKEASDLILKTVADFYGAESVVLYDIDASWQKIFRNAVWSRQDAVSFPETGSGDFLAVARRFEKRRTNKPFFMNSREIQQFLSPGEKEILQRLGVQRLIVIPVLVKEKIRGFLLVSNPTAAMHSIEMMAPLSEYIYREIHWRQEKSNSKMPDERTVVIRFLGDFEIKTMYGSVCASEIRSEQVIKLLSYLLLNGDRDTSVQKLAGILWTGKDSENPYAALRNLVYRARAALKDVFPEEDLLTAKNGSYCIQGNFNIVTDISLLESACRRYCSLPEGERSESFHEAMQLYRGSLLPMLSSEEWVLPLAGYYNTLFLSVVCDGAGWLLRHGQYAEVFRVCSRGLEVDSLNENLHCILMESLYRQGSRGLALQYYDTTAQMFARDYGVTPGESMRDMREKIAAGKL